MREKARTFLSRARTRSHRSALTWSASRFLVFRVALGAGVSMQRLPEALFALCAAFLAAPAHGALAQSSAGARTRLRRVGASPERLAVSVRQIARSASVFWMRPRVLRLAFACRCLSPDVGGSGSGSGSGSSSSDAGGGGGGGGGEDELALGWLEAQTRPRSRRSRCGGRRCGTAPLRTPRPACRPCAAFGANSIARVPLCESFAHAHLSLSPSLGVPSRFADRYSGVVWGCVWRGGAVSHSRPRARVRLLSWR